MTGAALTLKVGGVAGAHALAMAVLTERAEPGWVVVHGGGDEVAAWSLRLGIEPRAIDGLRVTDPATLEVAIAVLRGIVNARLVATFAAAGVSAIGLAGADGDLLRAERFDPRLGSVGRIRHVNGALLMDLADAGHVPVVAPIGRGEGDDLLNVNADEVAGAIAAERGGRLLLLTDVAGVQRDGDMVASLDAGEAERMVADGTAHGGMVPKLRAAVAAARRGCTVQIVDGRDPDAVRAALDGTTTGTTVRAASAARSG